MKRLISGIFPILSACLLLGLFTDSYATVPDKNRRYQRAR